MKLLLVEDNTALANRMRLHIPASYIVDHSVTGADAIKRIADIEYGVVVLDLGLPDMTGLDVCRHIRQAGSSVPILVLTGVDDMQMRVTLLGAGADDYLTKPFDTRELKARITALSRRQPLAAVEEILSLGGLILNRYTRLVTRDGTSIELRRKEFDILEYLIQNQGRVVTREMIYNNVWTASSGRWANTVDVHIKHLRDKVDQPFETPIIKTVYGIGYRVEVPERVTIERGSSL